MNAQLSNLLREVEKNEKFLDQLISQKKKVSEELEDVKRKKDEKVDALKDECKKFASAIQLFPKKVKVGGRTYYLNYPKGGSSFGESVSEVKVKDGNIIVTFRFKDHEGLQAEFSYYKGNPSAKRMKHLKHIFYTLNVEGISYSLWQLTISFGKTKIYTRNNHSIILDMENSHQGEKLAAFIAKDELSKIESMYESIMSAESLEGNIASMMQKNTAEVCLSMLKNNEERLNSSVRTLSLTKNVEEQTRTYTVVATSRLLGGYKRGVKAESDGMMLSLKAPGYEIHIKQVKMGDDSCNICYRFEYISHTEAVLEDIRSWIEKQK